MPLPDSLKIDQYWEQLESGHHGEVLANIGEVSASSPPVLRTLAAMAHLAAGNAELAEALFSGVLKVEPENPVARSYGALALFQLGRDGDAGKRMEEAPPFPHQRFIRKFLETFWPLTFTTSLGHPMRPEGLSKDDPHAVEFGRWRTHAASIDADLLERQGSVMEQVSEFVTARGRLHRSTRKLAGKYDSLGVAAWHRQDVWRSIYFFERGHTIRPAHEQIATNLAFVQLTAGLSNEAVATLSPVMERNIAAYEVRKNVEELPDPETVVVFARAKHQSGEHREALALLATVQPEGPEDYGAHIVAALCWLMLGETENFRRALDVALNDYFIDTWEQYLAPFMLGVGRWLAEGGRESELANRR